MTRSLQVLGLWCLALFSSELCGAVRLQVLDSATLEPVPNAQVLVEGMGLGGVTDSLGLVTIDLPERGHFSISVRGSGYERKDVLYEIGALEVASNGLRQVLMAPIVLDLPDLKVATELTSEDEEAIARRQAIGPTEGISGDQLKDVMDQEVSDSLEKVAGVTVGEEDGEASGVNIRGAGAKQTKVTLDGQGLAGGGGRGSTRGMRMMNQIPREFLQRIDVMKAPTPDLDADAIGGTIDLKTIRISGAKKAKTTVNLQSGFQDYSESWRKNFNLTHARPFELGQSGKKMGLLLGLRLNESDNGQDSLQTLNQWPFKTDPLSGEQKRVMGRFRVSQRDIDSRNRGLVLNTDLQLNQQTHLYGKILFNDSIRELDVDSHSVNFVQGKVESIDEQEAEFSRVRLEKQFFSRKIESSGGVFVLGASHQFDGWLIEESIGYSYSSEQVPFSENVTFRTDRIFEAGYNLNPDWTEPLIEVRLNGENLSSDDLQEGQLYEFFRYDQVTTDAKDQEFATQLSVSRRWNSEEVKWIFKGGLKGRFRDAYNDQDRLPFRSTSDNFYLGDFQTEGPASVFNGLYAFGPKLSSGVMSSLLAENPEYFQLNENDLLLSSSQSDYSVLENIYAAYALVQRETKRWVMVTGFRYELTDFVARGYEAISSSNFQDVQINLIEVEDRYSKVFPGLHFLYRPNRKMVFKLSLTTALQRPDFRDLSPSYRINQDARRIRSGNPDLTPFDAKAIDLGFDRVLNSWSSISLGLFYKQIDGFIVDVEEETSFQGEEGYIISRPINGGIADLVGVELAYSAQLQFLPGVLDKTSFNVNYTWTDSRAPFPGLEEYTIQLPEQIQQSLNANLRWKNGGWTISLRTRYRGLQLNQLKQPDQAFYLEGFWSHSIGINYKVSDDLSIGFSANNLNRPHRIRYQGIEGRMISNSERSRAFNLTVNWKFGHGSRIDSKEG